MSGRSTPRELGYSFPPEWGPQAGTWISWPRPEGISFPDKYHTVPGVLAEIVRQIARRQPVHINVPNGNWEHIVRETLRSFDVPLGNVHTHHIPTNECWTRDHGPAFVTRVGAGAGGAAAGAVAAGAVGGAGAAGTAAGAGSAELAVVDFGFNAWGGKYPPYDADDAVPRRIGQKLGVPVFEEATVVEGGGIEVNGEGTLLTTESCLLNPNRNPDLERVDIERVLLDFYGQRQVIWLPGGDLAGDDTDGHVDNIARFVDVRTLLVAYSADPADPNHGELAKNLEAARNARDADGRAFEVVELPMPAPMEHDGQPLPASYANFLFVNDAVLVPTYRDAQDERVLGLFRELCPGREVVGIDCTELIWGLGAIHCLTQQQPAV
ncbi:MAG: agmatine/peptidylarginine deiminase [Phycisphaerae bacterium]